MSERPYELDLYAARNRERAFAAVVTAIETVDPPITKKELADSIGRKPSQISLTLSGPSNWTLDTVSDLLRPIHATMEYNVVYDTDRPKSNIFNSTTSSTIGTGATANLGNTTSIISGSSNATTVVAGATNSTSTVVSFVIMLKIG